jgi:hypothetical protein
MMAKTRVIDAWESRQMSKARPANAELPFDASDGPDATLRPPNCRLWVDIFPSRHGRGEGDDNA